MEFHPDAEVIRRLGGPAALAKRLGYDHAKGGTQRVQNWLYRGIPLAVKVANAELFNWSPSAKAPEAMNG
ncbi:hypothetical protein [uncultured Pseudacidovorax sp.]|uniref:hypothetical protein n=1 Tax=uncultured Pseudacidovorax sp. TaxID=679313 RepID=UPI0025DC5262|nr:hypothetical protein [uncultured Pseudacidovorax sp.]